jgi:hypothetical protein
MSNSTEFISGRSRERARQLIDLATDAGLEPTVILTDSVRGGYLVPKKVAEAYAELLSSPATAEPATTTDTAGTGTDTAGTGTGDGTPEAGTDDADPQPAGNASQAVWADWAKRNKGYDESEGLTRDQLKERFGA